MAVQIVNGFDWRITAQRNYYRRPQRAVAKSRAPVQANNRGGRIYGSSVSHRRGFSEGGAISRIFDPPPEETRSSSLGLQAVKL